MKRRVRRRRGRRPVRRVRDRVAHGPRGPAGAAARPRPPLAGHALHPRPDAGGGAAARPVGPARPDHRRGYARGHRHDLPLRRRAPSTSRSPRRCTRRGGPCSTRSSSRPRSRRGVEARFGVDVSGVTRADTGRVTGVRPAARGGAEQVVRAALTVGADGLRSGVARAVGARTTWQGAAASAFVFGYWPARPPDSYDWYYRPGAAAGVIPTNDGLACVWAGLPAAEFADERRRAGLDRVFADVLAHAAPGVEFPAAERAGPLRGFPGMPARLRQARRRRLGAGRRRGLVQGPADRARHHRRAARRRAARRGPWRDGTPRRLRGAPATRSRCRCCASPRRSRPTAGTPPR